jgi:hypothetical protein
VRSSQPPLEYLMTCSQSALEGFELARLDEVSRLRAELRSLHEEWIEAEIAARLARLLLDGHRAELQGEADSGPGCKPLPNVLPAASVLPNPAHPAQIVERFSLSLFSPAHSEPLGDSVNASQPTPVGVGQQNQFWKQPPAPSSGEGSPSALPIRNAAAPAPANLNEDHNHSNGANRIRRRADSKRAENNRSPASRSRNCSLRKVHFRCETAKHDSFVAAEIRPLRQLLLFQPRRDVSSGNPSRPDAPSTGSPIAVRIFVTGLMLAIPEHPKTLKHCSGSYPTKIARR